MLLFEFALHGRGIFITLGAQLVRFLRHADKVVVEGHHTVNVGIYKVAIMMWGTGEREDRGGREWEEERREEDEERKENDGLSGTCAEG